MHNINLIPFIREDDNDDVRVLSASAFGSPYFVEKVYEKTTATPQLEKFNEIVPSVYDYLDGVWADLYIVSKLGRGNFGEAYLLNDETVVKFTSSLSEMRCVERILELADSHPEAYEDIFPTIYEYGYIEDVIRFDDSKFFIFIGDDVEDVSDFSMPLTDEAVLPVFWYRREGLDDLPDNNEFLIEINDKVNKAAELGIELVDYGPRNWGLRATGEVIFRDLGCLDD